MREPYVKGVARRHGPESCASRPRGGREALTGENSGPVWSSARLNSPKSEIIRSGRRPRQPGGKGDDQGESSRAAREPDTEPDHRVTRAGEDTTGRDRASRRGRSINACALRTRGKSRMRQFLTYGSVRGAPGNGRPYRDPTPSHSTFGGGATGLLCSLRSLAMTRGEKSSCEDVTRPWRRRARRRLRPFGRRPCTRGRPRSPARDWRECLRRAAPTGQSP